MTAITREMLEQRLAELKETQLNVLAQASAILGRIQECELLIRVLASEEPAPPEEEKVEEGKPEEPEPTPPALEVVPEPAA